MTLSVFGFGKLRLEFEGRTVSSFPTRQVEELFGYLVVHRGVTHPREKIINFLWPNYPIQSARGRLSTVLWRLKGVLEGIGIAPDHLIHASRDSITLPIHAPLKLDLQTYHQHLARASKAADDRELEVELKAAVALYQGDLFEGLYADWCLLEREHLYRLQMRAMGQLMATLMRGEAYEDAVDLGESILSFDALREEVHRALMRCYWKTGQHTLAARQFERCTTLLEDELGMGPMPETIRLYTTIVDERLLGVRELRHPTSIEEGGQMSLLLREFSGAVTRLNRLLDQIEAG